MSDTSYTIEGRADGFTPLFDSVVRELGTIAAVVYGVVWRHCQMRRQVCDASQGTMATLTGMAERTIRKWLSVLVETGYIVDITDPPRMGVPRTYVTTGRATLELTIGASTPAPSAAPPAPNAGVPRHLVPPTPAPNAAKDTIRILSEETREEKGQEVHSEGEGELIKYETLKPGEVPEQDPELARLWQEEILPYLQVSATKATYENWFLPITPIAVVGDDVLLGVNQLYQCGWFTRVLGTLLRRVLTGQLGRPLGFQFVAA